MLQGPACFLGAATLDDLPALVAMERACFTHPWTPAQLEEPLRHQAGGQVLVLRSPEAPGPQRLMAYCVFRIVLDELDISTLAVGAAWRRRGLGRWLLQEVLGLAARRGAPSAFLEVRQSNWSALGLYRSVGFDILGTRRDYYEDPREDAFLLRRDRPPAAGEGPHDS